MNSESNLLYVISLLVDCYLTYCMLLVYQIHSNKTFHVVLLIFV